MRMTLPLVLVCALALGAQGPPRRWGGAPRHDAVKQALNLSDAQIDQLQQLQRERAQALRPVFEQMQTRRAALAEALKAASPDEAAVGRLVVEMNNLRKQIREIGEKYHKQAVATLTAEQQSKLKSLEQAAGLRETIGQAAALSLLTPSEIFPGAEQMLRGPGPGPRGPVPLRGRMPGAWRGRPMPKQ